MLATPEGGFLGDDARGGHRYGLIDVHGWLAVLQDGCDELMAQERVRGAVAGVIAHRFGD